MKKLLLLLMTICTIGGSAFCQEKVKIKASNDGKFAIGLGIGTTPSLDVSYQYNSHLSVKLKYNYFKYNMNTQLDISDENIELDGNFDMGAVGLSLEYFPFAKSSFKLIGGVSYVLKGELDVLATPTENYTFGETVFTPEEVGSFRFGLDYGKGITPFVGIGFGRAVPKKRVGFGFELGTYYLKEPVVSLTGTERLSIMNEQEEKVQANMNDWRYWPMLNVRLAVRINK
ncbi:MAG: hypothetical protein ACK4UP_12590 [Spirosomataceae bacterium]